MSFYKDNKDKDNNKFHFSERTMRRFKYGTTSIILVAVVVVIFVLVNVALEQLPLTVDLTKEKIFSISDLTIETVEAIDGDIEIIALYDRVQGEADGDRSEVIRILDQYDNLKNVSVSYVDLDKNPGFVTETVGKDNAQLSYYSEGDYIVKYGDKTWRIDGDNMYEQELYYFYSYKVGSRVEKEVTTAIAKVTMNEEDIPVVYFSTGNGESPMSDYSQLIANIESQVCMVESLDISTVQEIPENANIIVFMGPKQDLSAESFEKLRTWFANKGGKAIFGMDVYAAEEFERFGELFAMFGLKMNNDVVYETNADKTMGELDDNGYGNFFNATTVSKEDGPFATAKTSNIKIFNSRSISLLSSTGSFYTYEMVQTSSDAVRKSLFDSSVSDKGKVTLAAAGLYYGGVKDANIVLFGTSNMWRDDYIDAYGDTVGGGSFIYSYMWMTDYVSTVGDEIDVKMYDESTINVTTAQSKRLGWFSILIYPLVIVVIGVVVGIRRRHL